MLVAQAAKAKGVTPEAFVQAEIGKRAKPVTDTDVRNLYVQNSERMQGRSFEQMNTAIQQFLGPAADDCEAGSDRRVEEIRSRDSHRDGRAAHAVTVAADDPSEGKADAPVTIVEFSDFQCPFCQRVMPTLKQLRDKYGDKMRLVWKDFPLTQIHPQAFVAAQAAQLRARTGQVLGIPRQAVRNQSALQPEFLKKYAADAGLDAAKFNQCLDTSKYEARVQEALGAGGRLGITSTPTVFVNGRMINGAQPIEVFESAIDDELARGGK